MKKGALKISLAAFVLLFAALSYAETLTNETVVKMVEAGLGEELIISKINSSESNFDVSVDGIMQLKKEGVDEKVITAMVESASGPKTSGQPPVQAGDPMAVYLGLPQNAPVNSLNIFVKTGDKVEELIPVFAETTYSRGKAWLLYPFSDGRWQYVRGMNAAIRLHGNKPVFYTKANPGSFLLVKLSQHPSKGIRFAYGRGGVYKNTVEFDFTKKPEGYYELTPTVELSPGEYAFIQSDRYYDFGVE